MTRSFCFYVAIAVLGGCSKASLENKAQPKPEAMPVAAKVAVAPEQPPKNEPLENKAAPEEPKVTTKTAKDAREELQARIDRFLGGQSLDDLLGGTIGIWAVGHKIESMEIVRVIQKYDEAGKMEPNQFVAAIKCDKVHNILGRRESKEFAIQNFRFQDGAWKTPFLQ